jgi:murein DD-endopeptidase MepM/ murein hydrolase activator NlpD
VIGWLALASLAAFQGQALRLEVADEPGLVAGTVRWEGHDLPLVRLASGWAALIGVDLETTPGVHDAVVNLQFADRTRREETEQIVVAAHDYPVTRLKVEPRYVELSSEDQARAAREAQEIDTIYATLTPERLWRGAFEVPIPDTTGGRNFGHRRVFNGQPRAPHSGADLAAATGTPIRASNRGRVVLAKNLFFSGNAVFLDHGFGVYSVYLHLSEIGVEEGALVERGSVLGLAGATGRVTGPHLHWGARVVGARVDPFTLLALGADD